MWLLVLLAAGICLGALGVYQSSQPSKEEQLQQRVEKYYRLLDANDLLALEDYISPEIRFWYGESNPEVAEVIKNVKAYRDTYPFTKTKIDWTKFKVIENEDGTFTATYPMEYKVKSKMAAPYRAYDLDLTTVWDQDFKIISAQEIRK